MILVAIMQGSVTIVLGANKQFIPPEIHNFQAHTDHYSASEAKTQKALQRHGSVIGENLATEMGSIQQSTFVQTITGKNSGLTFQMKSCPQQDWILEIQEIHSRRANAFGYRVQVNGKDVYFRTYEELGAGPNHYFVKVDRDIVGAAPNALVSIISAGEAPFSISNVWGYSNFMESVFKREGLTTRMPLNIHNPKISPEEVKAYDNYNCYGPIGHLGFVPYGSRPIEAIRSNLAQELKSSAQENRNTMYIITGYGWGGMPTGPDGRGGYFSDPRYSGLSYSKATDSYRASWPNMWGSSPFLTVTDPHMNQFLKNRLDLILGDYAKTLDQFKAQGSSVRPILVREWGANGGDLTQEVIDAAKKEGLDFDPRKGLSLEARTWLFRHGTGIWKQWAKDTREFIGKDSVLVDCGKTTVSEDHMFTHVYTHPDFIFDHPMYDIKWSAGQMGMSEGGYSSGEMGRGVEYKEIAMYDYLRANGRLAMVNMERTMLKDDFSVLKNHYQRGFQFLTFFNSYNGDEKFIAQMDNIDAQESLPAVHREPVLLDVNIPLERSYSGKGNLVSSRNIKIASDVRMNVEELSQSGELIYRIHNNGEVFKTALNLHIDGRVSPGTGHCIEVFVGDSLDRLSKVKTLTAEDLPCPDHWTKYMTSETTVKLGDNMINKAEVYIQLKLHAEKAPDAAFIISLHVGSSWAQRSGQLSGTALTIGETRALQLWVQERAVANYMLNNYSKSNPEGSVLWQAKQLIERGWYRSASKLLSAEISEQLPAIYVVRGYGKLGKYPIYLETPQRNSTARVRLTEISNEKCSLELDPQESTGVYRLHFLGFDAHKAWKVEKFGPHGISILAGEDKSGKISLENNTVVVEIKKEAVQKQSQQLPTKISGRCLSINKNSISIDTQDLALMNYDTSMKLPFATQIKFSRAKENANIEQVEKSSAPQALDRVELELNNSGEVTQIKASYGEESGKIKAFYPPVLVGQLSTGIIEMESGNRYSLHFEKSTGTMCDTVALQGSILNYEFSALENVFSPGQFIDLTYCPYAENGGIKRIRTINQKYNIIFSESYIEQAKDEWKTKAVYANKIDVSDHRPEPNYLQHIVMRVLRPQQAFDPGEVVYKISSPKQLKNTVIQFTARAFEDSSAVEFWLSDNENGGEKGQDWKKCGQFDNTWQNNIPQSIDSKVMSLPWQFIDISDEAKGKKEFYLKLRLLVNSADERYCVGAVRVVSED